MAYNGGYGYVDPQMAYAQQTAMVLYDPSAMYMPQMNPWQAYYYQQAASFAQAGAPQRDEQEKYTAKRLTNDPLNAISDSLFGKKELHLPKGKTMQEVRAEQAQAQAQAQAQGQAQQH